MSYLISRKALRLMQNILSLKEINKRILKLNDKYEINNDPNSCFLTYDYYPAVYEESIALLVELAVMMRREIDKYEQFGGKYDFSKVEYSNVGKYCDSSEDITFYSCLSKIIHADRIDLEVIDKNGSLGYGYLLDRNCRFSENVLITGRNKNGSQYNALIDLRKFCINAFMMEAWRYA